MKRRTLDIMFSAGGLVLAVLLLIVGIVLTSNASFAKNYVGDQLSQQHITFATVDKLTANEKNSACLVQYAGQNMTTGKQAECYANEYIGGHLKTSSSAALHPGVVAAARGSARLTLTPSVTTGDGQAVTSSYSS